MPHTINWKEHGLIRDFTGVITGSEIFESNLEMHGDQRFEDIKYVINDFSRIDDCLILEDELSMLAITDELATHANRYLKIAIVVTQDAFIDLARHYCELMRHAVYDAEIFKTLTDAQTWVSSPKK